MHSETTRNWRPTIFAFVDWALSNAVDGLLVLPIAVGVVAMALGVGWSYALPCSVFFSCLLAVGMAVTPFAPVTPSCF